MRLPLAAYETGDGALGIKQTNKRTHGKQIGFVIRVISRLVEAFDPRLKAKFHSEIIDCCCCQLQDIVTTQ